MNGPVRVHYELPALRLGALDYGAPFPGAPDLLLLHGMADLAWSLHPLAERLRDRWHVRSLDLRGHGESDHPGAYGLLHFVADLVALVELLDLTADGRRPVVVGHSLGGQIASQFAGLYPELVRALVVAEGIGPPVRLREADPEERRTTARGRVDVLRGAAAHRSLPDVTAAAARLRVTHAGLDPATADLLAEHGTRVDEHGGVVWKFDPRTRDWLASFDREAIEERWGLVRCPVLVVTGAAAWERWWSAQSRSAQSEGWVDFDAAEIRRRVGLFSNVRHVDIPDAGHMLPYDAPAAFADAVEAFLADHDDA